VAKVKGFKIKPFKGVDITVSFKCRSNGIATFCKGCPLISNNTTDIRYNSLCSNLAGGKRKERVSITFHNNTGEFLQSVKAIDGVKVKVSKSRGRK
jgi:hypothetical protein